MEVPKFSINFDFQFRQPNSVLNSVISPNALMSLKLRKLMLMNEPKRRNENLKRQEMNSKKPVCYSINLRRIDNVSKVYIFVNIFTIAPLNSFRTTLHDIFNRRIQK